MRDAPDRGAHYHVTFRKCARGFILSSGSYGELGTEYAFDRIEDVGAWFVEQYTPSPDDGPKNTDA